MTHRAIALGLLACLFAVNPARAQDNYPTKPIRMIIAFAVGGSSDILARLISVKMTETLGQQVLVDNRPGAGGNLGTDLVAKAAPDGYTILLGSASAFVYNPGVYKTMPFDSLKDFTMIGQAGITGYAFVVNKSFPATDLKSLLAIVKAEPGKYTYGSPGIGTVPHVCTEQFKKMTGADIVHVPYRGAGPVMNDLVAGQITMALDALPTSTAQVAAGTIKIIANGSITRAASFADVPTLDEQGVKGFDCYVWFGLFGPARLPPRVTQRLNEALNLALNDPTIAARLKGMNIEMMPHTTPESWAAYVKTEYEKWVPLSRASGAVLD
jgi:tripartite-type tricarboxylate transporter receptor subunit TctC